jgi:hypothetical protein
MRAMRKVLIHKTSSSSPTKRPRTTTTDGAESIGSRPTKRKTNHRVSFIVEQVPGFAVGKIPNLNVRKVEKRQQLPSDRVASTEEDADEAQSSSGSVLATEEDGMKNNLPLAVANEQKTKMKTKMRMGTMSTKTIKRTNRMMSLRV